MTDKLSGYSTTPASNNAAAPDGWPEGMTAGSVNNSMREYAARVREWYEDPQWIDFGHTIVSSTASSIKVSGDQTAIYSAGRAIRVNQSGSQVGHISGSAYSAPDTSISVTGFTVSSPTQVEVGAIADQSPLPNNLSLTVSTLTITGANGLSISGTMTAGEYSGSTVAGAMVASAAEMVTATATNKVVTPGRVKNSPGVAKFVCKVTGRGTDGTCTLAANTNITSVTRNGAGLYDVVIADDMGSADYVINVEHYETAGNPIATRITAQGAGTFTVNFRFVDSPYSGADPDYFYIVGFGALA